MYKRKNYLILFILLFTSALFQNIDAQVHERKNNKIEESESNFKFQRTLVNPRRVQQMADGTETRKVVVLTEDFSQFTAGNESVPSTVEISNATTEVIPASYTQTPGWTGAGVFQAGGICYLNLYEYEENTWVTGYITSPTIDLTEFGETFVISFKARSSFSQGDIMNVLSLNEKTGVYDRTPISITSEWKDYEVVFDNGSSNTIFQLYTDTYACFIDDIEVYYNVTVNSGDLPAPEVKPATNIGPTTFTANWGAVAGATHYLLDVYSYSEDGLTKDYFLQNERVTTNYCRVERLDEELTYYYTVRAADGERVSPASEEMKVEEAPIVVRDSPLLLEPTNVRVDGTTVNFTANWEHLEGTDRYVFYLFETYVAERDINYTFIHEDFEKVTQGTMNSPVAGDLYELLDPYTENSGWMAYCPYYAKGMLGLTTQTIIASPGFDLSANGGTFNVEITAHSAPGNSLDIAKGGDLDLTSEKVENRYPVFEQEKETFQLEYTHFNKEVAGGIYLSIMSQKSNAFIDEIKITKQLQKGDSVSYIFGDEEVIPNRNNTVQTYPVGPFEVKAGCVYSYAVVVTKAVTGGMEFHGFMERMPVEDLPFVSSVESSTIQNDLNFYVSGDYLYLTLIDKAPIELYSLSGTLLATQRGESGENSILLTQKGAYIVKVGDRVIKVVK